MFIIYDFLFIIFLILYIPFFIVRRKFHKGLIMRLGILPRVLIEDLSNEEVIWIHAVSVGEANSTQPLVKALIEKYPEKKIIISTVTSTGNERAKEISQGKANVIFLPLDLSFVVRKVIHLLKPKIFIIVETELWPNLLSCLHKNKIPVVFINGRISEKSYRGYLFGRWFIRRLIEKVRFFMMQSEADAKRIIELGANKKAVKVIGNTKFDIVETVADVKEDQSLIKNIFTINDDNLVICAGSTHYPEESILIKVYSRLKKEFKTLKLILVPRNTKRADYIRQLVAENNLTFASYSKPLGEAAPGADVLILDIMGKLKAAYSLADVCFVGGTLAEIGGHNLMEPALFSKPIIIGSHVDNCRYLAESLLMSKGAIMVKNQVELESNIRDILLQPALNKEVGENALKCLNSLKGATDLVMSSLEEAI